MACPNGMVQVGINPDTMQPICGPVTSLQNSSSGTANSNWWNQAIDSLPGVLGGVASIIGASKGNEAADNITIVQNPNPPDTKKTFPWLWLIVAVIAVVLILVFALRKKAD